MQLDHATEFSIYLDQRPGELAGLLDMFRTAGVCVAALCVTEHNGRGLVRIVGEPEADLRGIGESLAERGLGPVVEARVLTVNIDERPSIMRDLATALADHEINIRYAYLAPGTTDRPTRCIFRVDDPERAEKTLGEMDWPADTPPSP